MEVSTGEKSDAGGCGMVYIKIWLNARFIEK